MEQETDLGIWVGGLEGSLSEQNLQSRSIMWTITTLIKNIIETSRKAQSFNQPAEPFQDVWNAYTVIE